MAARRQAAVGSLGETATAHPCGKRRRSPAARSRSSWRSPLLSYSSAQPARQPGRTGGPPPGGYGAACPRRRGVPLPGLPRPGCPRAPAPRHQRPGRLAPRRRGAPGVRRRGVRGLARGRQAAHARRRLARRLPRHRSARTSSVRRERSWSSGSRSSCRSCSPPVCRRSRCSPSSAAWRSDAAARGRVVDRHARAPASRGARPRRSRSVRPARSARTVIPLTDAVDDGRAAAASAPRRPSSRLSALTRRRLRSSVSRSGSRNR